MVQSKNMKDARDEALVSLLEKFVQRILNVHLQKKNIKNVLSEMDAGSWEDFDLMVEETAISAEQERIIKRHLSSGQLHGQQ